MRVRSSYYSVAGWISLRRAAHELRNGAPAIHVATVTRRLALGIRSGGLCIIPFHNCLVLISSRNGVRLFAPTASPIVKRHMASAELEDTLRPTDDTFKTYDSRQHVWFGGIITGAHRDSLLGGSLGPPPSQQN